MVKHIVMWKLNETCDKKQASGEIKTALEGLMGKIPGHARLSGESRLQGYLRPGAGDGI